MPIHLVLVSFFALNDKRSRLTNYEVVPTSHAERTMHDFGLVSLGYDDHIRKQWLIFLLGLT